MKTPILIAVCVQLAASVVVMSIAGHGNQLVGQISGIQSPEYQVVDLRIRFYGQRRGGVALAEQIYPQVSLSDGQFSVQLSAIPSDPSIYVEIGLRPAGRRYAMFTTLLPRRQIHVTDQSLARVSFDASGVQFPAAGTHNPSSRNGKI